MNNIQPLKPSKQFEEAIIAEKKRLDEYIKQFGNSQVASDYLKGYYDREIVTDRLPSPYDHHRAKDRRDRPHGAGE